MVVGGRAVRHLLLAAMMAAGVLGGTEAGVQPEMAVVVATVAGRLRIELAALPMLIFDLF